MKAGGALYLTVLAVLLIGGVSLIAEGAANNAWLSAALGAVLLGAYVGLTCGEP